MFAIRTLFLIAALGVFLPAAARAQISIPGPQNFDFDAVPGETYEGSVLVQNVTDQPQAVRLYQTDYAFSVDGETYDEAGTASRSNAGWVQFSPSALTLGPGESRPVRFSVSVPEESAPAQGLAGSFWSMLMVEAQPVEALAAAGPAEDPTLRLNTVMRYGIQIATHVRGAGAPSVDFLGATLVQDQVETRRLMVDVGNTGERMTGPKAWVELYDETGTQVARAEAAKYRIYPGTSVRYAFDLAVLPAGRYEALVVLDAGDEDVYAAQYTLTL